MSSLLTQLALSCGTDKAHNYTEIYTKYFEPIKDNVKTMIEIGTDKGASANLWLKYFNLKELIMMDINECSFTDPVVKFVLGSQSNVQDLQKLIDVSDYKSFDIIIDDASHVYKYQQETFEFLFKYVSKNGFYIIEDIKCHKRDNNKKHSTEKLFVNYNKTKIIQSYFINEHEAIKIQNSILSCDIYSNKFIIIQKK